mmetsp:Transcript_26/g.70  ORF Transcript_26/g.70 Transcript_26/m.70 type:complete len:104 (+) Transcript_26:815-1126(+)
MQLIVVGCMDGRIPVAFLTESPFFLLCLGVSSELSMEGEPRVDLQRVSADFGRETIEIGEDVEKESTGSKNAPSTTAIVKRAKGGDIKIILGGNGEICLRKFR